MTNKIEKFLRKLDFYRRANLIERLQQIKSGNFQGLDIKMLHGSKKYLRNRIGRVRIIFEVSQDKHVVIHKLSFRDENTYK